jgi:hypothetical protein
MDGDVMIIRIDPKNPFIVTDNEGNVLFTHLPIDDEDLDGMTLDEQDEFIQEAIRDCYK